jgi:PAS domain S-box-containing protein
VHRSFSLLSIKTRAALFTTVGVLLAFGAFAVIEVQRIRGEMQEVLGAQQLTLISQIVDALDDRISSTHRALIIAAGTVPPTAFADLKTGEKALTEQAGVRSLFDDVYLIGSNGKVLIDLPALDRRGIEVQDREYFHRTMQTRAPVISEPYIGRGRKEPTVTMTAPVLAADGSVAGMVTGTIHMLEPNFLGRLREAHVGATGRFALVGRDRTIIVSRDAARIMTEGPKPGESPAFDHAVSGHAGWEESTNSRDQRASLYSYKPLSTVPWVLIGALPVEEAYAPFAAAEREAKIIATVFAALLAPLVWFGMQFVLAPIAELRDTIRKIRGDPESEALARHSRHDELGDVAEEFNAMQRERRAANQALRISQERYRSLTELASDWYWEQDEQFRFTSLHASVPGAEGAVRSSALGKTPWELPMLEMSPEVWAAHRAGLEAHQSFRDFEICRPGADGKRTYAAISGEPIFAEDGRYIGYRGVGRDITAAKLAASDADFRQRIESILLLMSSRFLKAQEHQVDSIIDDSLRAIGEFAEADRCFINRLDEAGQTYSVSHEWVARGVDAKRASRQYVPVARAAELWKRLARNEVTYANIADVPRSNPLHPILESAGIKSTVGVPMVSGGQLIGCLAFDAVKEERRWNDTLVGLMRIAADTLGGILAQRSAAAALRSSEEKFAKAFRLSPMFISISTVADAHYIEVNDAYLRGTGYSRDEVIGRTAYELGLWKIPGERKHATDTLAANGRLQGFEAELCKKSGASMICEIWAEYIEIDRHRCIIWLTVDVTERKLAEAEILKLNATLEERVATRTMELESAIRELEAFSYSISHDLRAPLRSIVGFSKVLAENLEDRLDEENQRFLDRIVDNATRMSRLIDEVLQYSRIARTEPARREIDLDVLVPDIVDELGDQYPGAEVVLSPLGSANADPTMIRQIFHNLISNALKYSSRSPQPKIEIGARQADGKVRYVVRDNGVGFDMGHADRLYELFTRLHNDPDYEGTGAGLAIVKRLVEKHGGTIHASAEPGKGASFSFTL